MLNSTPNQDSVKAIDLLNEAISLLSRDQVINSTDSSYSQEPSLYSRRELVELLPGITSLGGLEKRLWRARIRPIAKAKPLGHRRGPGHDLFSEEQLQILLEDAKTIGNPSNSTGYEVVYY